MEKSSSFSAIIVDSVIESKFGGLQAILKQTCSTSTTYKKSYGNSLDNTLFEGEKIASYDNDSTRVFFMKLKTGVETKEQVESLLTKYPDSHLFRILDSRPILSEEDLEMTKKGDLTLDTKANSQAVRDEKGNLVLHNGLIQYKRICFSLTFKEDIDNRGINTPYHSEELWNEVHQSSVKGSV